MFSTGTSTNTFPGSRGRSCTCSHSTTRCPHGAPNKVVSTLVRDWTIGASMQYTSGLPFRVPNSTGNLNQTLFQSTWAERVPGQPLFLQDLNCHCFDPTRELVLNPAAWPEPAAGHVQPFHRILQRLPPAAPSERIAEPRPDFPVHRTSQSADSRRVHEPVQPPVPEQSEFDQLRGRNRHKLGRIAAVRLRIHQHG